MSRFLPMRIANLPWYDFVELAPATDAFWRGVARHAARAGIADVPLSLDRSTDHATQWRRPELLFSQACGYDVLYDNAPDLAVIATPRYAAPGCEGGNYCSAVVVREDDGFDDLESLRGSVCVVNERSSHSGTNALRPLIAPLSRDGRFFRDVRQSGDHVVSLEMLGDRRADVACVDVVVLELCRRVLPRVLKGLRILRHTAIAPAPPYVTSRRTPPDVVEKLRAALLAAMADPELQSSREALLIAGVDVIDERAYRSLVDFESPALDAHYFELPAPCRSPLSGSRRRELRPLVDDRA